MREYRQGDTVRLRVTVRDPHGVKFVYAIATREGSANKGGVLQTEHIRLEGTPPQRGPDPVTIDLLALVTNQLPGVYVCQEIQAYDGFFQVGRNSLIPPRRFRIVESAEDDREGPEVLEVGEFS